MSSEIVRVFEALGSRFEVTAEFDTYNIVRSEQARKADGITARYTNAARQCQADFEHIVKSALEAFSSLVKNRINSALEVASVGFIELQRCQNEILPRIGKRLIFKYTKNELISVDDVASHIKLDAAKYFSGFMNELQQIDDRKQNYFVSQEYKRLTRRDPAFGGIGFGVSGIAGVAAGTLAASAGLGILHSIGEMVGQGISDAIASKDTANSVTNGKQALYKAFGDMADQVGTFCIHALEEEMNAELDSLDMKPFMELSEERISEIKAKSENYDKAYRQGDITPEKYAAHIFTMIKDTPHNLTLYYNLYKAASDANAAADKETIIKLTKYLGLEGHMERWLTSSTSAVLTTPEQIPTT